ncbi:MAG: PP2C family protein-serine/threonine phosphatase [Vulcanimicrobiaceae bacterium]|jgi:serine phosphatase RsbU (regulator of sigma subunit)
MVTRSSHGNLPRTNAARAIAWAVASREASADELRGGDVVDVIEHADGSALLLLADLSSKGRPADDDAWLLTQAFRAVADDPRGPAWILRMLNRLRFGSAPSPFDVTIAAAFVALVDRRSSSLTYAAAGHDLALIVDGDAHRHLDPTGPLLGVSADAIFSERVVRFADRDVLVVATDGFTECRNRLDRELFGSRGVAAAARTRAGDTPLTICERIARAADRFCGEHYRDDATVASFGFIV